VATEAETFQGSRHLGILPTGCMQCRQGAKMVLFVTGICPSDCFYCPVSEAKIDHDVVFANERKLDAESDDALFAGLFEEVEATSAWGTGVTGGDPLADVDRTARMIKALKERFGNDHHIHLYTQQFAREGVLRQLKEAGLDELRIHPHEWLWSRFEETPYKRMVEESLSLGMTTGIEIPCIPGREHEILHLASTAKRLGCAFLNMNELEYSEVNAQNLRERGHDLVGDEDNRVKGSMQTGYGVIQQAREEVPGFTVHFCSSRFKDGTQLTKRFGRRRKRVAKPYMEHTEDNTLIYGILQGEQEALIEAHERLLTQYEVPLEWLGLRAEPTPRLEIAPWVLEEVYEDFLDLEPTLVEEYPTSDRMEVERIPLRLNPPQSPSDP
jgi:uncharacterized protein